MLALLGAGQDPNGMEFSPGATAGGFAAFAAHEVEGARSQRPLGSHGAQEGIQGAIIAPEALAETGRVRLNLCADI